jgi:hypothetical protein
MDQDAAEVQLCAACHVLLAALFCTAAVPTAMLASFHASGVPGLGLVMAWCAAAVGVTRLVLAGGLFGLRPWARSGIVALSALSALAWTVMLIAVLVEAAGSWTPWDPEPLVLLFVLLPIALHVRTVGLLRRRTVRMLFAHGAEWGRRVSF